MLKKALIAVSCLILAGCNQTLPIRSVGNDLILTKQYSPKFGVAVGLQALYTVYGKSPAGLKAGTAQGLTIGKFSFRIKELLDKNPSLVCPEAEKASQEQEKQLEKIK